MFPPQPYPPAPAPVRRWWQHPALIIALLVVFPPGGIGLAWTSGWGKGKKIAATLLAGLWFLAPFLGDPPKKTEADEKAKPQPSVTQSATAAPTPSATPSPTPSGDPRMPGVMGKPFSEAEKAVEDLIDGELTAYSAYNDVSLPASYADWSVCFQGLKAGAQLVPKYAKPTVHLVAPGTKCPEKLSTDLHPKPAPTNNDGTGTGSSSTSTGGTSSSGGSSTGGSGDSSSGVARTPGAYCSPAGATGVSKTGKALVCGPASDGKNRWHS